MPRAPELVADRIGVIRLADKGCQTGKALSSPMQATVIWAAVAQLQHAPESSQGGFETLGLQRRQPVETLSESNFSLGAKMKKTTLLALMISTAPFSAKADSVTGALTLSYTEHSEGSDSMDTKGLDGRLNVDMDNGLSFGFDIGRSTMSQTGVPVDFEAEFYSVDARYRLGNGFSAGVFADRLSMGIDLLPIDLTIKTNGFILG